MHGSWQRAGGCAARPSAWLPATCRCACLPTAGDLNRVAAGFNDIGRESGRLIADGMAWLERVEGLQGYADAELEACLAHARTLRAILRASFLGGPRVTVAPAEFFAEASRAIDATLALGERLSFALDQALARRATGLLRNAGRAVLS